MKRAYFLVIAVVLLALPFSSCMYSSQERSDNATFTIGLLFPLTGDFAQYGRDELNAIMLFMENVEATRQSYYSIAVEDTESNPAKAILLYSRIKNKDPDVVLSVGSAIGLSFQTKSNKDGVPSFVVGANPELAKGYMIQNLATSDDFVFGVSKELKSANVTKLGIIYLDDDFGQSVKDALKDNYEGEIVEEMYSVDQKDFRSLITKIKSSDPDAIFIVGTGKNLGFIINQIRILMGNITIYSTPEISYADVKEVAGSNFYNIVYSDVNIDYSISKLNEFRQKYIVKYGFEPSIDSILAYNSMIIIDSCSDDVNFYSCINENTFAGLNGPLEISDNRIDFSRVMRIKKI